MKVSPAPELPSSASGDADAALEAPPPRFSEEQASRIALDVFGHAGAARDFGGERDQTFVISGTAGQRILKISNASESPSILDLEWAAITHVQATDPELPVAGLCRRSSSTREQADSFRASIEGQRGCHFVRLFEYAEGSSGVPGPWLSPDAVRALGEAVGRVGLALRGFFHPAAGRHLLWDVKHGASLRRILGVLDVGQRALVERAIGRFEEIVLPAWPRLRAQVVHGDPILENLRFDRHGRVSGIIDFGDIVHSSLLQDVASALASVMRKRGEDALATARIFLDGYTSRTPLEPIEFELLGATVAVRLAAIVTIGAWHTARYPEKASHFADCAADSWLLLQYLDEVGPDAIDATFGVARAHESTHVLAARRRRLLGAALTDLFYDSPVHAVRGEGAWLVDADGRRLLDGYNNVAIVGHCHPRVTEAVVDQTRRLNTHSRYLYEPLLDLAERLINGLAGPYGLDTVMVVNSGSEANDLAWRIATTWTGGSGGIVSACAYHGMTMAVSDLSPQQWPAGHRPSHVERFEVVRAEQKHTTIAAGVSAAGARLSERGIAPAALFLECGFLSDGIIRPDADDLRRATEAARAAGALVVADEVQMGHGRSGGHLWCFEEFGIRPDFVTLGKPMGNGYPVAAVITRSELAARFGQATYFFSTFGGNPVAARAALAVLDVIRDEQRLDHAARVGAALRASLRELAESHPAIREIRGHGLLAGVELADPSGRTGGEPFVRSVVDDLREQGVLVGRTGPQNTVLKIRPPLVFDHDHVARVSEALDASLHRASWYSARGH